jgi:hypothetical protein
MGRLTRAGYLMRGIDRLLLAILQTDRRLCKENDVCEGFFQNGTVMIRDLLTTPAMSDSEGDGFEIYEFLPFDHHGNFGYKLMANYTVTDDKLSSSPPQHHLFTFDKYHPFTSGVPSELVPVSHCRPSSTLCHCLNSAGGTISGATDNKDDNLESETDSFVRREPARSSSFSDQFSVAYDDAVRLIIFNRQSPVISKKSSS